MDLVFNQAPFLQIYYICSLFFICLSLRAICPFSLIKFISFFLSLGDLYRTLMIIKHLTLTAPILSEFFLSLLIYILFAFAFLTFFIFSFEISSLKYVQHILNISNSFDPIMTQFLCHISVGALLQ